MLAKKKAPDFTDYAYREAVNRLKYLLAESYTPSKPAIQYHKSIRDDSGDETESVSKTGTDRPALSEISKYLSPPFKSSRSNYSKIKSYTSPLTAKETYPPPMQPAYVSVSDYASVPAPPPTAVIPEATPAPPEILNYIEKQEDYIEQLEKESQFCRDELSNLLGKVRDVISENESITEHARADLSHLSSNVKVSGSSESDENFYEKSKKGRRDKPKSSLSGPKIIFESRICELEAELAQANIDLKKIRTENEELKRRMCQTSDGGCDLHRKQIDGLQRDKMNLEETLRKLQAQVELLRAEGSKSFRSRDMADLALFEKSQADMEIKHLREELERQHERVREIQHEMARRIGEERSNAERRYNYQVDQLGGDLSCQWEQVTRLQLELEREKRAQQDCKRDLQQRNAQIEELKNELKAKRTNFLSEIAQVNAEKQSLEQEITSLRLQLERAERQSKIEASRLTAEISSLRQRLDRSDADILHARRENLRLNDEISNLEKELTLGEMKNEVRPTRSDINKTITEMETKHVATVRELEDMIHSQKTLMDKLTAECKTLTNKLEDTSLKHKVEIAELQSNVEFLTNRIISNDRIVKNENYSHLQPSKAPTNFEPVTKYEPPTSKYDPTTKYEPSKYEVPKREPITEFEPVSKSESIPKYEPLSSTYNRTAPTTEPRKDFTPIPKAVPHDLDKPIDTGKPKFNDANISGPAETFNTFEYGDDENEKERTGDGDKYRRDSDLASSDQMYSDEQNPYETDKYDRRSSDQRYTDQGDPGYSTQYDGSYSQGYGQQPYDTSEYETDYGQSYLPQSEYEGEQPDYSGYTNEDESSYQPEPVPYQPPTSHLGKIEPIGGAIPTATTIPKTPTISTIPSPAQQTTFKPSQRPTGPITPATGSAGTTAPTNQRPIGPMATTTPTAGESKPDSGSQQRTSISSMGSSGPGDSKRGSLLSQQPTEGSKGLSSATKQ